MTIEWLGTKDLKSLTEQALVSFSFLFLALLNFKNTWLSFFLALHAGLERKKKLRSAFSAFKLSWKESLKTYIDGLKNDLKSPQNAKSSSSLNQDEPKLYKV